MLMIMIYAYTCPIKTCAQQHTSCGYLHLFLSKLLLASVMVYVPHGLNSWQLQLFGIIILSAVGLLMILNGNSLIIRLSQDALVVDQSFVHQISLQLLVEAKTYSSRTIIHTSIHIYISIPTTNHITAYICTNDYTNTL